MNLAGLILGSNLDKKEQYLESAISLLAYNVGAIQSSSSLYFSPPWGYASVNDYVNQVILIRTNLSSEMVLQKNLLIENVLGRIRESKGYSDRTIDIDILFYNEIIVESESLIIPHPRLHLRRFCLEPLAELLPNWVHPEFNKSIVQLLEECEDNSELTRKNC